MADLGDLLHEAATRLRDAASHAIVSSTARGEEPIVTTPPEAITALADWLDSEADVHDASVHYASPPHHRVSRYALDVAHAILDRETDR